MANSFMYIVLHAFLIRLVHMCIIVALLLLLFFVMCIIVHGITSVGDRQCAQNFLYV